MMTCCRRKKGNSLSLSSQTNLCLSFASRPSTFGSMFHNFCYQKLNLDWLYLPRQLSSIKQLAGALDAVRGLGIRGCSLSMPFKEAAIPFLDQLDPMADSIDAVNTVKNMGNGILKGYNTDAIGAERAFEHLNLQGNIALVLGAGGVSKAVGWILKNRGCRLLVCNRTLEKAEILAKKLDAEIVPWQERNSVCGDLLVNCTSVGMAGQEELPIQEAAISKFNSIFDAVVMPRETLLMKEARHKGKHVISGVSMCLYQAAAQFQIYTGQMITGPLMQELQLRVFA